MLVALLALAGCGDKKQAETTPVADPGRDVMEAFVAAAADDDAEGAWELLSGPAQRRAGPTLEDFERDEFPELKQELAPFAEDPLPVEVSEKIDDVFGVVALSRGKDAYATPLRLEGRRLARRAREPGAHRRPRAAARLAWGVRKADRRREARRRRRRHRRPLPRRRDARRRDVLRCGQRDDLRELRDSAEARSPHGGRVHERRRRGCGPCVDVRALETHGQNEDDQREPAGSEDERAHAASVGRAREHAVNRSLGIFAAALLAVAGGAAAAQPPDERVRVAALDRLLQAARTNDEPGMWAALSTVSRRRLGPTLAEFRQRGARGVRASVAPFVGGSYRVVLNDGCGSRGRHRGDRSQGGPPSQPRCGGSEACGKSSSTLRSRSSPYARCPRSACVRRTQLAAEVVARRPDSCLGDVARRRAVRGPSVLVAEREADVDVGRGAAAASRRPACRRRLRSHARGGERERVELYGSRNG